MHITRAAIFSGASWDATVCSPAKLRWSRNLKRDSRACRSTSKRRFVWYSTLREIKFIHWQGGPESIRAKLSLQGFLRNSGVRHSQRRNSLRAWHSAWREVLQRRTRLVERISTRNLEIATTRCAITVCRGKDWW